MSKHDLKGVDTSKVGNNKYVNYTFKDYMEDQGLSKKGALKSLGNIKLSDLQVIAPTLEQPKTKTLLAQSILLNSCALNPFVLYL